MTARNKLFAKLTSTISFTHVPGKDKFTKAIIEFDAEGMVTLTNISRFDHEPLWRVDRGVNW